MKRALPLTVLMALGASSGCAVEERGLRPPDAFPTVAGGEVSPASGIAAIGGAPVSGQSSGGASGNAGTSASQADVGSGETPRSGGTSGSGAVADTDAPSASGGAAASNAGAGADDGPPGGDTSASDAGLGTDAPAASGGAVASDAGLAADASSASGGASGSDAGLAADAPSASGGASGSDAGAGADEAPSSDGTSGLDTATGVNDASGSGGGSDADLGSNPDARSDGMSGGDTGPDSGNNAAWRLVWSDEFDLGANSGADLTKWTPATWEPNAVNGEQQKYTARLQNVFHDGQGHLVLRGLHDSWASNSTTYPYTSGRVQSDGKFQFRFGRVEVRAKLPAGRGSYPAILLMGTTGTWPQCGEIGIVEQWGQDKSWLYCSTYSGASRDINEKVTFPNATTLSSDFHVYALEWYADHMVFFTDDVMVARFNFNTASPFYTGTFYFILDVAIGGTMGGAIDDTGGFPMDLVLDYVRVYSQ